MLKYLIYSLLWLTVCLPAFAFTHGVVTTMSSPLGTNLSVVSNSTPEQPFIDIFKTGSVWLTQTDCMATHGGTSEQAKLALDANGWPTSLSPVGGGTFTCVAAQLFDTLTTPFYSSGQYAVLYTGAPAGGSLTYYGDATGTYGGTGRDILTVSSPSAAGVWIGINGTISSGSHFTDIHLIYCGVTCPANPCVAGSTCSTNENLFANGEIFNPIFITKMKPFRSFRFVDWERSFGNTQMTAQYAAWSARPVTTQAFWGVTAINSPACYNAGFCFGIGVPIETAVALSNKMGTDAWFSIPSLADATYLTQSAILIHNTIHSNANVYIEIGDEMWGAGDVNQGSTNCDGIGCLPANQYTLLGEQTFGATVTISIASPAIITQTAHGYALNQNVGFRTTGALPTGITAGPTYFVCNVIDANHYSISTTNGGGCLNTSGTQSGVQKSLSFPGFLFIYAFSYYTQQLSALADAWAVVWGTDFNKVIPLLNTQQTFGSTSQALLGVPGTNNQFVYSGTPIVGTQTSFNVKGFAAAPYYGYEVPQAWSGNIDGGMANFFTEVNSGGLIPASTNVNALTPVFTPNNLGGSPNAYTLTSDVHWGNGAIPATPANGTMIQFKVPSGATACGGSPCVNTGASTLAVDGGTAYPISYSAAGTNVTPGQISSGPVLYAAAFTNKTSSGSVTASWVIVGDGGGNITTGYAGGMIKQAMDSYNSNIANNTYGLTMLAYEGGAGFGAVTDGVELTTLYQTATRNAAMLTAQSNYYTSYSILTGATLMNQYVDVSVYTIGAMFGLLENTNQSSATPKYAGAINFINSTQCWWSNCRH